MEQMNPANYRPVSAQGRDVEKRRLWSICQANPPPLSLMRLLLQRLEQHWHGSTELPAVEEDQLAGALYKTKGYLRRRAPNEIEAVLTTIDDKALVMISQSFATHLNLAQFAEAIVKTGTYDSDHVLAFVGGVIDLFLEVLWSQAENATEDQEPRTVNYCQLMNHFIESPEIAMYESNEVTMGLAEKAAGAVEKQVAKNSFVDRAKHMGSSIEKMYWIPYLEMMATIEGTESVYFWSPTVALEAPKTVTPELPQEKCYDKKGKPLFKVLAMDWDPELQDLAVLLSNRMLIVWRLRNKEKGQFQQKRELRFDAKRGEARGDKEPDWKVFLNILDPRTMENLHDRKKPEDIEERGEATMRRELREQRLRDEASAQLDIWFNNNLSLWVTSNSRGRLFMWDLRKIEGTWLEASLQPTRRLSAHTRLVTSHLELSKHKFTTCSLDRSVLLWDNRNMSTPEMKITDHTGSVLSQAYLPLYNMLVSVGCEKTVYCWTIDTTAYRGVRKKLSGHQSNLQQVAAGSSVFFTMDESFLMILWDALTLVQLQTISCRDCAPRHVRTLSQLGKVCVAGRRLSFYEGNEHAAIAIGATPTKDFVVRAKMKQQEGASLKERAPVKWVGLASHRGTALSATEAEVRLHTRGHPEQFRTVFNAPEGDAISDIAVADRMALVVLGTAKGAIYFLKYRSGCALKVYPGRTDDLERRWHGAGKAKAANDAEDEAGADGEQQARARKRVQSSDPPVGSEHDGRTKSPAAGSRSPVAKAASAAASPQAAAKSAAAGQGGEGNGDGAPSEEEGKEPENPLARGTAPRGGPLLANAPTMEELARGLSRKIKCVLPCEDEKRVYVGTAEGQVIIFRCDSRREFPVERWATCPDLTAAEPHPGNVRADAPAVTCLHCVPRACVATTTEEEAGLLLVGTQDGVVHLYNMVNLKLAGSINIPRALPSDEDTTQRGERICHLRLFEEIKVEPELPLTLLTVDAHSQLRIWGFKIHVQEWKLITLKLILDAGQLLECHCVGGTPQEAVKPVKKSKGVPRRASKAAQEAVAAEAGAGGDTGAGGNKKGKEPDEGAVEQVAQRKASSAPVRITAVAALPVQLVLPSKALRKQPRVGPKYAIEAQAQPKKNEVLRMGLEANGKPLPAEDSQKRGGASAALQSSSAFITQTPKVSDAMHVSFKEDQMIKEGHREVSGSESEGDSDHLVGRRLYDRPKSPARLVPVPAGAEEEEAAEAEHANLLATAAAASEGLTDGRRLIFLADSGGWIWCIDIAASIEGALARSPPIAVNLNPPYKENVRTRSSLEGVTRRSVRPALSNASLPNLIGTAAVRDDERGLLMTKGPLRPHPEVIKVAGAWPAHPEEIVSLAPLGAPPALVSTDTSKEVKIWSTGGELWGHFAMRGVDGAPPVVAVWPPPHVLAAQIALMKTAKGLCKKMGFATRKEGHRGADKLSRQHRHVRRQVSKTQMQAAHGPAAEKEGWGAQGAGLRRKGRVPERTPSPALGPSSGAGRPSVTSAEERESTCTMESGDGATEAKTRAASKTSDQQDSPVSPDEVSEAAGSPNHGEEEKKKRKAFTTNQMNEMIRHRAFSSGFQSYRQFARKADQSRTEMSWRSMRSGFTSQEEAQRSSFLCRPPSAFGVELFGDRDAEAWESGVRGLSQSASEGALLRYAHTAVEKEAKWVREALGVDISKVTRKQIRSASFLVRLDSWPVSNDPGSPISATFQAVKRLNGESVQSGQKAPATPPLVGAGAMTMGGTRPQRGRR